MTKEEVTRKQAEDAVRTLLRWLGEDSEREGLLQTPKRVISSYHELFRGYNDNPAKILSTTFTEVDKYNQPIFLRNVAFKSFCEHHILPIIGYADIAYHPAERVVGISKLARIVDCFAMRLQIQERMTSQIAEAIETYLKPKGVAVVVKAHHSCMSHRGANKDNVEMITSHFTGCFVNNNPF
jgi:GTP cyclohydrolase I